MNIFNVSTASLKNARIAPRKARLTINLVRSLPVSKALGMLDNSNRKANPLVAGVIRSAVANALQHNSSIDADRLYILEARVDKARVLKRMRPRAMGRGAPILKRCSHIMICLGVR